MGRTYVYIACFACGVSLRMAPVRVNLLNHNRLRNADLQRHRLDTQPHVIEKRCSSIGSSMKKYLKERK